jgi:GAF domain-containing protein
LDVGIALTAHRKALAGLMHSDALKRGDVAEALQLVTEVAAELLHVERASVWLFPGDRSSLECKNLYERTPRRHTAGAALPADRYPAYFAALNEERSIAAHEALTDPRTCEFATDYLAPNRISSMLDAPVFVRGTMAGVVCHEHVGGARRWRGWEELVAGSIADFVALALESARRSTDEQRLTALVAARTAELVREIAARVRFEGLLRASEG